jgi:hypothetical protein
MRDEKRSPTTLAPRFRGGPGMVMFWDEPRAGSTDGSQNTGSPAAAQNTGSGLAPQPGTSGGAPQDDRQHWIDLGMSLGIERALKKLELGDRLEDAQRAVTALRQPKGKPGEKPAQPTGQAGASAAEPDVSTHPKYQELLSKAADLEDKYGKLDKQISALKAQADEARTEKLKAAALMRGVGSGRQLDAFVQMYGNRVAWGPNRELVVTGVLPDGSIGVLPKKLDEFLDEALAESRFLLAPTASQPGQVSRPGPTQSPTDAAKTEEQRHRESMRELLGSVAGGVAQQHRFFERRK